MSTTFLAVVRLGFLFELKPRLSIIRPCDDDWGWIGKSEAVAGNFTTTCILKLCVY
jgi:hypothetical protein